MDFVFVRMSLIPGGPSDFTIPLLALDTGPNDKTPPSKGDVTIRQINATYAEILSSGFEDEETKVVKYKISAKG